MNDEWKMGRGRQSSMPHERCPRAAALLVVVVMAATPAPAVIVPGGGSARSDCYAQFQVTGAAAVSTRSAQCTDGDSACDFDAACNGRCRMRVAVCLNQCSPLPANAGLRRAFEKGRKKVGLLFPSLLAAGCGDFIDVDVPQRRGHAPGVVIKTKAVSSNRPHNDNDVLKLVCLPRSGACPTTTTSTSLTSTTTESSTTSTSVPSTTTTTEAPTTSTTAPETTTTVTETTTTTEEPTTTTTVEDTTSTTETETTTTTEEETTSTTVEETTTTTVEETTTTSEEETTTTTEEETTTTTIPET